MASPITTTGTSPNVSTSHQNGESVRDWVGRHNQGVKDSSPGTLLETCWVSSGGPQKVTNSRLPGETDAAFRSRHIESYLVVMIEKPPLA